MLSNGKTVSGFWGSEIGWRPNTNKFLIYSAFKDYDAIHAWAADDPAGQWYGPCRLGLRSVDPGFFANDVTMSR